ncbi:MAG: hypothetical protein A2176_02950 [Spirochaetes bacterium RBG_13_51_14]|nr:MAG: hypothetical protein A2176_02950 [Spirochaetes bacterium RBG_13_51_14]
MDNKDTIFNGFLVNGGISVPVRVSYASRFSVFVSFTENIKPVHGTDYEKLILSIESRDFEFSSCRILLETNSDPYAARLVFLNDLFDFKNLFFEQKLINLETLSKNLSLILSQKENVKETFKNYITELAYDIKVYQQFFDDLDRKCANEPEQVREVIFNAIVNSEGKKFEAFYEEKLNELEQLIAGYTNEEHRLHGFYLRKQMWDIILRSEFMARTNIKPRGYAGDSVMMRMLYENAYCGDSTFARILNKFGLNVPAAQSVRNRRVMISKILRQVQQKFADRNVKTLRIMSVACGPAFELSDLFITADDTMRFQCTLLDQDPEALGEAEENIHRIEAAFGHSIQAIYLQDSVRTMLRTPDIHNKWGRFHFIYSMGLFDYLTQPVAKAVIEKIYSLLEPGGSMFIGNYHVQNRSRWFMEYWLDWVLYYRTEEDMIELIRDTDAEAVSILFEESGCQMFLSTHKPLK